MGTSAQSKQSVAGELDAIADLSRDQLIDRWTSAFKQPPPKGISRTLLERSAAYQAQIKRHGSLSLITRRALKDALSEDKKTKPAKQSKSTKIALKPGMRLVREWNGRIYSVDVIEGGFVWDGRVHKSLSVIARKITGARWSGPRFFGL